MCITFLGWVYFFDLLYGCAGQSFQFLQDLVATLGELFCNISLLCLPPRGLADFNKNHHFATRVMFVVRWIVSFTRKIRSENQSTQHEATTVFSSYHLHPWISTNKKKIPPTPAQKRADPLRIRVLFFRHCFFLGICGAFLCVYFSSTKVHPIKWVVGQLVFFRQIVDINGKMDVP